MPHREIYSTPGREYPMTDKNSERYALLSVSDRSGLIEFARGLTSLGFTLLTTSGTGKALKEEGLSSVSIEDYTGQDEILGGRVKTLHPKIHGGILARSGFEEDESDLRRCDIARIEVVAVNLYPFETKLSGPKTLTPIEMVEMIDIGGPTMIRAAAKNFQSVFPVLDPLDYPRVLQSLQGGDDSLGLRRELAVKVFTTLARYNLAIASYFSAVSDALDEGPKSYADLALAPVTGLVLERKQELRYGENPHQRAGEYSNIFRAFGDDGAWQQFGGKQLSFNNLLDLDAGLRTLRVLPKKRCSVAILKHLTPCGAAVADSLGEALERAKLSDPRSHFGGIIAFSGEVDEEVAESVAADFAEIVVAPKFSTGAREVFKKKKNLRVIEVPEGEVDGASGSLFEVRSAAGSILVGEHDSGVSDVSSLECVTSRKVSETELEDLDLAWRLCSQVKSNAITLVREGMLLAGGGGQTSRIDALEVAFQKCDTHGHDLKGAVAASDAFFPFVDCVEKLAERGVTAIVVPSGAKRDDEVRARAEELGLSLIFAPDRHFRH